MKPEVKSQKVLKITQSKAKMYEYNVPLKNHIDLSSNPASLFPLAIGLLGDVSVKINDGSSTEDDIKKLQSSLPFSARFFDSFIQTKISPEIDPYVRLLGSTAYYLCDMPGSSNILAKQLESKHLAINSLGLENLLAWLLITECAPFEPKEIPDGPYYELILSLYSLFSDFCSTGLQVDELTETARRLRVSAYDIGTARELLLSDLIGAVVKRRVENSTWKCLPKYSDLPISTWFDIIQKKTFIKEFWPAQRLLGERNVFRGNSAVIQMPTSAGKTKATELIIRSAFLSKRASLTVIIAPFRALCHEIRLGLVKAFQNEKVSVDELSDILQKDYSIDRFLRNDQVLVATPEKFNYVLRHEPDLPSKIGLIIYDEGHQFDNGNRGITYELLLTSLKTHILDVTQTILISAVIRNAKQISEWLISKDTEPIEGSSLIPIFKSIGFASNNTPGKNLLFVNPQKPEEEEFFVPRIFRSYSLKRNSIFPDFSDGKDLALYLGLQLVHQGSVAVFCGKKDSVRLMCEKISKIYKAGLELPSPATFSNKVEVQKFKYLYDKNMGPNSDMTKCAELGVFAHHNNVPHGLRLSIEHAIKEDLVKFVICTSTLAQGVNLPIRYLIVTSIYQGEEQISVRDFQNLIGRSGRSGMHTEGSILFADPRVYDDRKTNYVGKKNWKRVKNLLDPSKSEECSSKLLTLFDPLSSDDDERHIAIDLPDLLKLRFEGQEAITLWIRKLSLIHGEKAFTLTELQKQVSDKINIISAIESYLMANWDLSESAQETNALSNLAKSTLAYFLADDHQKEQIVSLFNLLAHTIETNVPEPSQRIVFGKTMYGVPDSLTIYHWLEDHISEIRSETDTFKIFNVLWPLMFANIHNRSANRCDQPDAIRVLAEVWLEGKSFDELFQTLSEKGAKLIHGSQLWNYKIEYIVDICENGFSYEGVLVLGAIIEFAQSLKTDADEALISELQYLQKRLKYGLPNQASILLYELGFADRVVAIDLSSLLPETPTDKERVILSLKAKREEVFEILNNYPSYYSEVYRNQVA